MIATAEPSCCKSSNMGLRLSKLHLCKSAERTTRASAMPVVDVAAGLGVASALQPVADAFSSLGLPMPIVKYSHPVSFALVLLGMGGYSTYLGFTIRASNANTPPEVLAHAKTEHPKLARGMTIAFSIGAVGGLISLLSQSKPLFQSPHAITGIIGLLLLYLQGLLPMFFEDDPNARSIHAYFGASIMALFALHMTFGINLALSL